MSFIACDICEGAVSRPAGPALREQLFLDRGRRCPTLHITHPRVCSVECFEVEKAAHYLKLEPTALKGVYIEDMSTPEQLKQGIMQMNVKVQAPAIHFITLNTSISI